MIANRVSRAILYILAFLALYVIACQSFAMDASPAMTGLPGESSMTKFVRFIFGPVAYTMMSVGIVVVCVGALGAIDLGKGIWAFVSMVIIGGILVFSQQFMTTLFSGATVPTDGIPAHEIVVSIEDSHK